jgi:hypothetical protein
MNIFSIFLWIFVCLSWTFHLHHYLHQLTVYLIIMHQTYKIALMLLHIYHFLNICLKRAQFTLVGDVFWDWWRFVTGQMFCEVTFCEVTFWEVTFWRGDQLICRWKTTTTIMVRVHCHNYVRWWDSCIDDVQNYPNFLDDTLITLAAGIEKKQR